MKHVTDQEWQTILEQSPSNAELHWCMDYTSKKDEAWKIFCERNNGKRRMIDMIKERSDRVHKQEG